MAAAEVGEDMGNQRRRTGTIIASATVVGAVVATSLAVARPPGIAPVRGPIAKAGRAPLPPARKPPKGTFFGLPALVGEKDTRKTPFYTGPKPPPTVAEVIKLPVPAPKPPSAVKPNVRPKPLDVVRMSPKGKQKVVASVTAQFNQPMVPVASLDDLAKFPVPLRIEPKVDGKTRWLGTRTVAFERAKRFPFSTRYTVTIPAGAASALGAKLAKKRTWTFETPRLQVRWRFPNGNQNKRDTPIAVVFNQRIDRTAVHRFIAVRHRGRTIDTALVPPGQWPSLKRLHARLRAYKPDRVIVLRPTRLLPAHATFHLEVRKGAPSAEGPLPGKRWGGQFSTYPKLRFRHAWCRWKHKREDCYEGSPIRVEFSNALATDNDIASMVTVTPKPDALNIRVAGRQVHITGAFNASTTYRVKLKSGLRDGYGQATRKPFSGKFTYREGRPVLQLPSTQPVVIESRHSAQVVARVRSLDELEVDLLPVTRKGLLHAHRIGRGWYPSRTHPFTRLFGANGKAGRKRFEVKTGAKRNKLERVRIDVRRALAGRKSGIVAMAVKAEWPADRWWKFSRDAWASMLVQVTDIGVTARWDNERLVVMAARLSTGKPLQNAKIELIDGKGGVVQVTRTDKDGFVKLNCKSWSHRQQRYVWASVGDEFGFVHLRRRMMGPGATHALASFIYTERAPYKPGEVAHINGILRRKERAPDGGVVAIDTSYELDWTLRSARGLVLRKGRTKTSASGGFHLDIELPDDMDLGNTTWRAKLRGGRFSGRRIAHRFQVQHYRAPEFEVHAAIRPTPSKTAAKELIFGGSGEFEIHGKYYFGAPMAGSMARWSLNVSAASYRPPRHSGWTFGRHKWPVWRWRHYRPSMRHVASGAGTLDSEGRLRVQRPLLASDGKLDAKGPFTYRFNAVVIDDNNQRISKTASAVVHRGRIYAGLRTPKAVVKEGTEVAVDVVAPAIGGDRTGRAVELELFRLQPDTKRKAWHAPRFGRHYRRPIGPGHKEIRAASCTAKTARLAANRDPDDPRFVQPDGQLRPRTCRFRLDRPGQWLVRARVRDERGRITVSEMALWSYGSKRTRWRVHEQGKVQLIADKPRYDPGDTAVVLVRAPTQKARGVVTLERAGIVESRIIVIENGAKAIRIPLDAKLVPGVTIGVSLLTPRTGKPKGKGDDTYRPRSAIGRLYLPIALTRKRVNVAFHKTSQTIAPGAELDLTVKTTDHAGKPIASNVTVFAVDEGVLALLGFKTPAPLLRFYRRRAPGVWSADVRTAILVEKFRKIAARRRPVYRRNRGSLAFGSGGASVRLSAQSVRGAVADSAPPPAPARSPRPMMDMAKAKSEAEEGPVGGQGPAPVLRSLFASTAFFRPGLRSDASGTLKVRVKMPQNATTFRLMAVVDDGDDRFGSGDDRVTLRQPVILRSSLPRFASLHDDFDAAVMLHNHTGADRTFIVGGRASGIDWHDDFSRKLRLADGAAEELHFRVRAVRPGRATFQFAARVEGSKDVAHTDAVQTSIPINLPATLEAFATYGSTTKSVAQPVAAPRNALPGFGGLDLKLSSTALVGMEDAVRYLHEYPYECAEQTASRLIPIAVLGDILDDFGIGPLAKRGDREKLLKRAVKRLVSLQHWDGGFKFWPKARRSSRWITPWVTFALLQAKGHGASVPRNVLNRASAFMRNRLRRSNYRHKPWWRTADTLAMWILSHPLNNPGGPSTARATARRPNLASAQRHFRRLYGERQKLPVFARLWLSAIAQRIERTDARDTLLAEIDALFSEKAGTAHLAESVTEDLRILMHSSDRTDAIALATLVEVRPNHPLRDKLVRGLMEARIKGRWSTTQANAWALVAMRSYYEKFEAAVPDFQANMWLGKGFVGGKRFKGRKLQSATAHVPIADVIRAAASSPKRFKRPDGEPLDIVDAIIAKKGAGRMYYRLGMRYAPADLRLPASEQGFTVMRTYAAANPKQADRVRRLADGSWQIKVGTDVRVDLTVVVLTRGHYVVVDDPLPAGLEPINPLFRGNVAVTGRHSSQSRGSWRWYRWWTWNHTEMRDDRVLLFADRLWAGVYSHSYSARATTVGKFVAGPTRAEEMYAPETFGRTATAFVTVVR